MTDTPEILNSTVPASYIRIIAQTLGLQEQELDRLLARSTLPTSLVYEGDDGQMTSAQQMIILDNAFLISEEAHFGLRLGENLNPDTHGPMGYLVLSSPDVMTALQSFVDYLPLRFPFSTVDLIRDESGVTCTLNLLIDVPAHIARLLHECFGLMIQSVVETVTGQMLTSGRLKLKHRQPDYFSLYADVFHCPVSFHHKDSQFFIPSHSLHLPNVNSHHRAFAMAQEICISLLNNLPENDHSTRQRVKRILLSNPPGTLSVDDVARNLFMTVRTLQRRLTAEGATYRQVLDEIYADFAERQLKEPNMTVESIAALLGYNDTAAFRKAFKRWFGQSPAEYRSDYKRKSNNSI